MGEKPAKEKEEKEEEMVSEFGSKFSPGTAARAGQEWTSEDNDKFESPGEKKPEEEEDDDEAYQGDMVPESKEQLRQWKAMSAAIAAGTVSEESTFAPGTPWTNARMPFCYSSTISTDTQAAMNAAIAHFANTNPGLTLVDVGLAADTPGSWSRTATRCNE